MKFVKLKLFNKTIKTILLICTILVCNNAIYVNDYIEFSAHSCISAAALVKYVVLFCYRFNA